MPCPEHQISVTHCDGCGTLKVRHSEYRFGPDYDSKLDLCEGCFNRAEMARDWLLGGALADENNPAFEYIRRLESAICALAFEHEREAPFGERRSRVDTSVLRAKHALEDARRLINEDVDVGHPDRSRVLHEIQKAAESCSEVFYDPRPLYFPTAGLG